jgi:hypothetical protein
MAPDEMRPSGKGNGRRITPLYQLAVRLEPEEQDRPFRVLDRLHQEIRHLIPKF